MQFAPPQFSLFPVLCIALKTPGFMCDLDNFERIYMRLERLLAVTGLVREHNLEFSLHIYLSTNSLPFAETSKSCFFLLLHQSLMSIFWLTLYLSVPKP